MLFSCLSPPTIQHISMNRQTQNVRALVGPRSTETGSRGPEHFRRLCQASIDAETDNLTGVFPFVHGSKRQQAADTDVTESVDVAGGSRTYPVIESA